MTSVDDLFKKSGVPSKRKLEPVRDPSEIYKSARTASNGQHGSRHARVEDATPDDPQDDDVAAGPRPPDEDDYGPDPPPDDDEGRFFGGGITKEEEQILDYVDGRGEDAGAAPEKIDGAWLRRTALNFERRISKNAELRAKFADEPRKFIASEADLDADVKALSILGEHPELYPEFARMGCVGSLVSLLAHENTDIAIDAIEIIGELTDEDVAAEDDQWDALVEALMDADLIGLLVSNLERLDEKDEADAQGVYHSLGVLENLCSRTATAEQIGRSDELLRWLLARVQRSEKDDSASAAGGVSQNKQYAAEMLAILAQTSATNRQRLASRKLPDDVVDTLLQLVAAYRRRDPAKGSDEEEYMENLFEALTCIVDEPAGKGAFLAAEGVELCLLMLKEGKRSRIPALRLLDHAAGSIGGDEIAAAELCERIVEAAGLKPLFSAFMKKKQHDAQATEHLLGLFASLLRRLPAQSAPRIRTLAKFVEKDYEKTVRLLELRGNYAARLKLVDEQIAKERKGLGPEEREDMEAEWLARRLEAGLFSLQTVDVILAWLVAEDDGAKKTIEKTLKDGGWGGLRVIKATLEEQMGELDPESEEGRQTREMLGTLMDFL